ncbi:MAG TPA: FAD-dependent monooxygenase [Candidatus Nitrosotenuis sp.]|nr:FAD-dependent monooxygenase [Candidatus Nitrosotenuis sp.]
MRINVVGGGPAGLYFALLARRQGHQVQVWERHPAHVTYGWGVVFSSRTLSYLRGPDEPTWRALQERLIPWDNVEIVHPAGQVSIRGHRFSGIARLALLEILQRRCAEVGVQVRFGAAVQALADLPAADLLVGADGVHSVVRQHYAEHFQPRLREHSNRYIWLGTPRLFQGLTLTFRPTRHGLFIAHSYRYDTHHSTFIVECSEEAWQGAGLGRREPCAFLQEVFAEDLQGQPLLSNQSRWIRFATLRNRRWSHPSVALLGDALHTAHFSIGSGTKLAMEDAIALAGCLARHSSLPRALQAFEEERRPAVERFQEAAQRSAEWFEQAGRDLDLPPLEFAYRVLTRSARLDDEELRRRDPKFMAAWQRQREGGGGDPRRGAPP